MGKQNSKYAIIFVLFLMSMSLHLQVTIFTPYAVSMGATSLMVGILLSSSSFANFTGNIIAGPLIDKIGKKWFIVPPLIISGIVMSLHAQVSAVGALFFLRILNGFALAFLFPAAMALLSDFAKNSREQGTNMAIYGLFTTISTVIAPYLGGLLAENIGYSDTYLIIGSGLLFAGVIGIISVKETKPLIVVKKKKTKSYQQIVGQPAILSVFIAAFTLTFFFGTLQFELPYLAVEQGWAKSETGKLFGYMGIGTFVVLSMFWIQRFSAFMRVVFGTLLVSFCFYQLAVPVIAIPLKWLMLLMGTGIGIMIPAIKTLLTEIVGHEDYGKAFAVLSAVYSLGFITSSLLSGAIHSLLSPYFFAFILGMITVTHLLYHIITEKGAVKNI